VFRWEPLTIVSPWGSPTVRADLGRIRVPENRASGSAREIELAFVRIPALSPSASSKPPIVWLAGGPGESGIADLDTPALRLFLELRRVADVVVLDQRGTGLSVPRLDCPGGFSFAADSVLDRARALAALEAAARACSQRWRAEGVDLSAYNARESAEDLEDLRVALGASRLQLLAGSWGTHLALAALRAHEDRFERAVLLGVAGPDHLRTRPSDLDAELASVARLFSAGRQAAGGDLLGTLREVRERLASRPAKVSLRLTDGSAVEVLVGRFELDWYVRSLLSSRDEIAHLPALLAAMGGGDFRELAAVSARWRSSPAPSAARFAGRCASGASAERVTQIDREHDFAALSDALDFAEQRVCRAWGVEPLPDEFRAPVRSRVVTLLVSGSLDGTTPESNAAEVLRGLPRASQLFIEGGAHGLLAFEDPASRAAVVRFFETGDAPRRRQIELAAILFERVEAPVAGIPARPFPALPSPFGGP
jgi:pimeloyl-ACP methyl ester carboxylesterase